SAPQREAPPHRAQARVLVTRPPANSVGGKCRRGSEERAHCTDARRGRQMQRPRSRISFVDGEFGGLLLTSQLVPGRVQNETCAVPRESEPGSGETRCYRKQVNLIPQLMRRAAALAQKALAA